MRKHISRLQRMWITHVMGLSESQIEAQKTEKETTQKIRTFLHENGFKQGVYGGGFNNYTPKRIRLIGYYALVKPEYSPIQSGAYTLAISTTTVAGYVCEEPCKKQYWYNLWEKPYNNQKELLKILQEEIAPSVLSKGCWNQVKDQPRLSNDYSEYKIEILLTPHTWDNQIEPYYWCILGWSNSGWVNTGKYGWAATPQEAFSKAIKSFCKDICEEKVREKNER